MFYKKLFYYFRDIHDPLLLGMCVETYLLLKGEK